MTAADLLLLLVIPTAFVTAVVLAARATRRRNQAYAEAAARLGLVPAPEDEGTLVAVLAGLALMTLGQRRRPCRIHRMAAPEGTAWLFDLRVANEEDGYTRSVVAIQSAALRLPLFALEPATAYVRMLEVFGRRPMAFPNRPAFAKRYRVFGDDEAAVRHVLADRLLADLETGDLIHLEGRGDVLVIHANQTRPDRLPALVQRALAVTAATRSLPGPSA